jgi:glycosyltransferase involved in cell wall biosynthesis
MRIAILGIRGVPSGYSGYEAFAEEMGSRLVERGHEVLVYCRRAHFIQRPPVYKGMRLIYLPSWETKELSTFSHTFLAIWDVLFRKVDVALICNVANGPFCLISRLFGLKTAINVDGLEWLRPKWSRWGRRYFKFAARAAIRLSHVIVTDAEAMRQYYRDTFGVDSVCIAYGANIETSTDPDIVRTYGLEPGRYYLIASRLVPDNNADLIVQAFNKVRTDTVLAIAGGAPYRNEFADRVRALAGPQVRFLGHINDQRHIKELHCNAYAYIHGHEFGGTNPALLKALGFGNCVLALDTPFNREVLDGTQGAEARYGILYRKDVEELAAKIQQVEDHPELQAAYARRAPERIRERYTWEHITDQYEQLFRRMTGKA